MLKRLLLTLSFVTFTSQLHAEPERKTRPINLSIAGPISTNLSEYEEINNRSCLGIIACSSHDLYGLAISIAYNDTVGDMYGLSFAYGANRVRGQGHGAQISVLGNLNQGEFSGFQLGSFNLALGERTEGLQAGLYNQIKGRSSGMQVGIVNLIQEDDQEAEAARPTAQIGLINISNKTNTIPFGPINLTRGGRFSLEISHGALGLNRLSLLSGSRYFYIIWDLNSRVINPGKDKYHHPDTNFFRNISGIGGAIPIFDSSMLKLEALHYSPTYYARDRVRGFRLLFEFELYPYLNYHIGLEHIRFRSNDRSHQYRSFDEANVLTFGTAFNLIGGWR